MSLKATLATAIIIPFGLEDPDSDEGKAQAKLARSFPESKALYNAVLAFQKVPSTQNAGFANKAMQTFLVATLGSFKHKLINPTAKRTPCSQANCQKLWSVTPVKI